MSDRIFSCSDVYGTARKAQVDHVIAMTSYTVGLKMRARGKVVTIEAEDALLATLKIKLENPDAAITYVRKSNKRGDRHHPHEKLQDKSNA